MSEFIVCALYRFTRLDDHEALQQPLKDLMLASDSPNSGYFIGIK